MSESKKEVKRFSLSENLLTSFLSGLDDPKNNLELTIFYNGDTRDLYIARNSFGTVPLFYIHVPDKLLAFSTSISYLTNLGIVREYISINRQEIQSYLSNGQSTLYNSETFFNGISSIIPGQFVKFSSTNCDPKLFAKFNPEKWKDLKTVADFGGIFKELFFESISKNVQSLSSIGAHLSGGLDSSSISSTVAYLYPEKLLHTFYSLTNTKLTNESKYALDVVQRTNSIHHNVDPGTADMENLIFSTSLSGQPGRSPISSSFHVSLLAQAKNDGCEILLTGHGGDSIVGHGRDSYFQKLLIEKDWLILKEQFNNISNSGRTRALFDDGWDLYSIDIKRKKIYEHYLYKHLVLHLRSGEVHEALELIKISYTIFGIIPSKLIGNLLDNLFAKLSKRFNAKIPTSIINDQLKADLRASSATEINDYSWMSNYDFKHFEQIIFKNTITLNEEYFALSNFYNLTVAHPFFDHKLYELCLAVPLPVLFNNGVGRSPLREAMKGILPETVRNRTDKAAFNIYSHRTAVRLSDQSQDFMTSDSEIWSYVDRNKYMKAVQLLRDFPEGIGIQMRSFVNRTVSLAVWLDMVKNNSFLR